MPLPSAFIDMDEEDMGMMQNEGLGEDMNMDEALQTGNGRPITVARLDTNKEGEKPMTDSEYMAQSKTFAGASQSQATAAEESEDEEWSFMSKLKSLKNKLVNKVSSKFKSQHVDPAEEAKEESDGLPSDDEFYVDPPEYGDQFMACKPWIGAIKEPDVVPAINPAIPDQQYEIDFVHGYKSDLTRQNLYYNNNQQCVYMTAALGIILDTETRT